MAKKTLFANPDSAEREYTRAMLRYSADIARAVNATIMPALPLVKAGYEGSRMDAWDDPLTTAIAEFLRWAMDSGRVVIEKLPKQFTITSAFNEVQFRAVFKANTGMELPPKLEGIRPQSLLSVNVFRDEPFLKPLAEGWIAENTALIKSVPEKLASDVEGIVRRGTMAGKSVRELTKEIRAKTGQTPNRAKLIAQDQTLKLNADLTRNRLQSVGVSEYIWRSVQDSRVRPEHVQHNGETYSWAKPPSDGHPGQPVRCRCRAEAVWPD